MSALKLSYTIGVVDKATANVQRINRSFNKLTQPIDNLRHSMRAFSKESGITRLGKSFRTVGMHARDTAGHIGRVVAPLTTVMGLASAGGLVAMAKNWGEAGTALAHTAKNIGISTTQLQTLQQASVLFGGTAEGMTSSMRGLGSTMHEVFYGRNNEALAVMNQLGISLKQTSSGAVDTEAALMDLSDALAQIDNPQTQMVIAEMFGVADSLPLLRKGSAGIKAYIKEAKGLGAITSPEQIKLAEKFKHSLGRLQIAGDGLKDTISAKLAPALGPLIEELTNWVAINREAIATKIGAFVKGFADALREVNWKAVAQGLSDFASGIQSVVRFIGGWKNAAIALIVVMNASLLLSLIGVGKQIFTLAALITATLIPALAAGALNAAVLFETMAAATVGIPTLSAVLAGLSKAFLAVGAAIAATPIGWVIAGITAVCAAGYYLYKYWDGIKEFFSGFWEDVGDDADKAAGKINNAGKKIKPPSLNGGLANAVPSIQLGDAAPSPFASGNGGDVHNNTTNSVANNSTLNGGGGMVQVDVTLHGAPAGTTATARASGNVMASSPNISFAMPTTVMP